MREAPGSLIWRPLSREDAKAAADLLNAMEAVDHIGENYDEQDTLQELIDPYLDLERATLGAFDGDAMAGYMKVAWKPAAERVHRVVMDGGVHPAHRRQGVGTRLVEAGVVAAQALHARHHPTLELEVEAQKAEHIAGTAELFRSQGFAPVRFYQHMEHPLGEAIPEAAIPDGFSVEPWAQDSDEDFRMIRNEAYRDEGALTPMPPENWKNRMTDSTFRPEASFLLRDAASGAPAGMLLTKYWKADTAATGMREAHFILIGTLRKYRRRGVASALIGHALGAVAHQGYDRASLRADSAEASGAFGICERAGFLPRQRHVRWALKG